MNHNSLPSNEMENNNSIISHDINDGGESKLIPIQLNFSPSENWELGECKLQLFSQLNPLKESEFSNDSSKGINDLLLIGCIVYSDEKIFIGSLSGELIQIAAATLEEEKREIITQKIKSSQYYTQTTNNNNNNNNNSDNNLLTKSSIKFSPHPLPITCLSVNVSTIATGHRYGEIIIMDRLNFTQYYFLTPHHSLGVTNIAWTGNSSLYSVGEDGHFFVHSIPQLNVSSKAGDLLSTPSSSSSSSASSSSSSFSSSLPPSSQSASKNKKSNKTPEIVPQPHLQHSFYISNSAITAMLIETPNIVFIGTSKGEIHRLSLETQTRTLVIKVDPTHQSPIRFLQSSPSPIPIKKGKGINTGNGNGNGKKIAENNEESSSPSFSSTPPGGPIVLWCGYGFGSIKAWDFRFETGELCFEYHHNNSFASTSSLSFLSAIAATSSPRKSALSNPNALSALPISASSNSPSIIHCAIIHNNIIYTAHEEKKVGVMNLKYLNNKDNNSSYSINSGNGSFSAERDSKLDLFSPLTGPFIDSIQKLILIPLFTPAKPREASQEKQIEESIEGEKKDEEETVESDINTLSSPKNNEMEGGKEGVVDSGDVSISSAVPVSPYLLATSLSGGLFVFPLVKVEDERKCRSRVDREELEKQVETWLEKKLRSKKNSTEKTEGQKEKGGKKSEKNQQKGQKEKKESRSTTTLENSADPNININDSPLSNPPSQNEVLLGESESEKLPLASNFETTPNPSPIEVIQ